MGFVFYSWGGGGFGFRVSGFSIFVLSLFFFFRGGGLGFRGSGFRLYLSLGSGILCIFSVFLDECAELLLVFSMFSSF